jgi:hypothetical protein
MANVKINVIGANMTAVHLPKGTVLFSYETPVAAYVSGRGWVRTAEKFSKTTSKHINQWLGGVTNVDIIPQSEIESLTEVVV